jgi:hypothetical protein
MLPPGKHFGSIVGGKWVRISTTAATAIAEKSHVNFINILFDPVLIAVSAAKELGQFAKILGYKCAGAADEDYSHYYQNYSLYAADISLITPRSPVSLHEILDT